MLGYMGRIKPGGKVFRDPVHQLIRIAPEDEFVLDLIDTAEFQRLRRIRQLGVSWLTFHGAEHSRFVHSLGVFNFAQLISEALQRRYGQGHRVSECLRENNKVLKAAALLHDLGHAPFSHLLERALSGSAKHELVTSSILRSPETAVGKVLQKHNIAGDAVASIIDKTFPTKFITDIVSSQLDADRMDYLLRDSYCTGVSYGRYDSDWLLHAMCIGTIDSANTQELCLDASKGVYAAERFIIARLHMYQQVYMHRVTRGYEVLLINLFRAASAAQSATGLPLGTPSLVEKYFANNGKLPLDAFRAFDESQIVSAMHIWASTSEEQFKTLRNLSNAFLNRESYYAAQDIPAGARGELFFKLSLDLSSAPFEDDGKTPTYSLDSISDTSYKGYLYRLGKKNPGSEELQNESILVTDSLGSAPARPVESKSKLLQELDNSKLEITRFYFAKQHEPYYRNLLKHHNLN
jgi:HD superfamily phosphohydrolase